MTLRPRSSESLIRRVVVGIDFGDSAMRAARWCDRQFDADGEIILVHALELPRVPAVVGDSVTGKRERPVTARAGAYARLAKLSTEMTARTLTVVRTGDPAAVLARAASVSDADLIMVGEHGGRTGLSKMLGSTPQRLVRRSLVPVLLFQADESWQPRTILVALDETDRAAHVRDSAAMFGAAPGTETTVIGVMPAWLTGMMGIAAQETERQRAIAALRAQTVARIDAHCRALADIGIRAESLILSGDPAAEILGTAARIGADLIVVGLRRAAALEQALFGAVANTIMCRSSVPVLVVPESPLASQA